MTPTTNEAPIHQLEITTRCNYSCFYCYGRQVEQRDMDWYQFLSIVRAIAKTNDPKRTTIQLQGEGEPSLHPQFWNMQRCAKAWGFRTSTISNGTTLDERFSVFDELSISLDTIDLEEADRIGRVNVSKVMRNLEDFVAKFGGRRMRILTVNYGQGSRRISNVSHYAQETLGIRTWVMQPLQQKDDYVSMYADMLKPKMALFPKRSMTCGFIEQPIMRFYSMDDKVLPCCFIKDTSGITDITQLESSLKSGDIPSGCRGCNYLREHHADI